MAKHANQWQLRPTQDLSRFSALEKTGPEKLRQGQAAPVCPGPAVATRPTPPQLYLLGTKIFPHTVLFQVKGVLKKKS